MTSIVGVLCNDGVVIGADSAATFSAGQLRTMEQPTEKLEVLAGRIIVAGTGAIGLGQRFCAAALKVWNDNQGFPRHPALDISKAMCKAALEDFSSTYAKMGQYGALVAFPAQNKFHLCEFGVEDFQPEMKTEKLWYASMGCAQQITDPFLGFIREVFWDNGLPSVHDAINAVTWTLDHAISLNTGGVNGPIRIAVLGCDNKNQVKARLLSEAELGEPRQYIDEAKNVLRGFRLESQNGGLAEPPPLPSR